VGRLGHYCATNQVVIPAPHNTHAIKPMSHALTHKEELLYPIQNTVQSARRALDQHEIYLRSRRRLPHSCSLQRARPIMIHHAFRRSVRKA
jgi:hypothetical protein